MRFDYYKLVFLFIILLNVSSVVLYADMNPQDVNFVIAVVNGEKIFYKDIKADPRIVQLGYPKELDSHQMEAAIYKYEREQLVAKIREVIETQKIAELNLTVGEEEIDRYQDEQFKIAGIDDKQAKKIVKDSQALADALEKWQKDLAKGDIIYNEKLASRGITKQQWKAFQVCYDTPEKLAEMRSLIPRSIADMKKNSRESAKKDLLFKKLRDIVAFNVSVSDYEIERYYQQKYGSLSERPNLDEVKDSLRLELLSQKKQEVEYTWWQEQYKKAKIEIRDERFKDIVEIFSSPK